MLYMTQKRKRYDKQFKIAAARVVLGGEMRAVDLARELGIKDPTLGRWAQEHGGTGESAFPGNGSPKVNKDYEIAKLRKRIEEPGRASLVDRAFDVEARNRLWAGGIAYVGTGEGWPCLATVIDALHRKVVGWSMSGRMTEKLVADALGQAVGRESPPGDFSLVFHDDQGSQHASRAFQRCLESHGDSPIHVAAGQPVGRRARGILLQDAQARAGERQGLQDEGGGEAGRAQIHRPLLQRAEDALIDRL